MEISIGDYVLSGGELAAGRFRGIAAGVGADLQTNKITGRLKHRVGVRHDLGLGGYPLVSLSMTSRGVFAGYS